MRVPEWVSGCMCACKTLCMQVVLCHLQPHLSLVHILVEPSGRGGGGGPHGAKSFSSDFLF